MTNPNIKVRVTKAKDPKKILAFGPLKIHLRGFGFQQAQYVSVPIELAKRSDDEAFIKMCSDDYVKRIIRTTIVKVEGLEFEDDETGEIEEFNLEFVDPDTKLEITMESYYKLMQVLDTIPGVADMINEFYVKAHNVEIKEYDYSLDKKKD